MRRQTSFHSGQLERSHLSISSVGGRVAHEEGRVVRSSRSKKNFIALKQKNINDEINNFFMNSH